MAESIHHDPKKKGIVPYLASMKLGLCLIFIQGGLISLGTVIPQDAPAQLYLMNYGDRLGKLIVLTGLDHLYRSWWYIFFSVLLLLNLVFCLMLRVKRLKNLRAWGSFLIHGSLLVLFIGCLISGAWGHREYVELAEGDTVNLATKGFSPHVLTLKEFRISYYENYDPQQYYSDLTLQLENRQAIQGQTSVNHPFQAGGLKIYQTSYGWVLQGTVKTGQSSTPFTVRDGDFVNLNDRQDLNIRTFFIPDYDAQTGTMSSKTPLPQNPRMVCAMIQGGEMTDFLLLAPGESKEMAGCTVTFTSFRRYSGLEIKQDPGIPYIFAGFVLVVLGLVLYWCVPHAKIKKEGREPGGEHLQ
ncbi:cytochrome c biogenesis protein ResB [Candidatus Formimonas warabiya]|uniref:ResB-like domain-containing protein n=1 Tax=Formimonas warabiya TaxID=1761012 RepID=A0A3G1KY56_FORW1|nr:cytochrome c biogenesis protein ResB [Candidatus Formimonas warabiya]ATW27382.1 hypothetical protein DCMF_23860 [Candidatus Formimonas warabiya]